MGRPSPRPKCSLHRTSTTTTLNEVKHRPVIRNGIFVGHSSMCTLKHREARISAPPIHWHMFFEPRHHSGGVVDGGRKRLHAMALRRIGHQNGFHTVLKKCVMKLQRLFRRRTAVQRSAYV